MKSNEKKSGNLGSPKAKNSVAMKVLPPKVTNKSSAQFVLKKVPKVGQKMLAKGMKKLSKRYEK